MAITTDNGKLAVLTLGNQWAAPLPLSPGTLGQDDQQQLLWGFPEILWATSSPTVPDTGGGGGGGGGGRSVLSRPDRRSTWQPPRREEARPPSPIRTRPARVDVAGAPTIAPRSGGRFVWPGLTIDIAGAPAVTPKSHIVIVAPVCDCDWLQHLRAADEALFAKDWAAMEEAEAALSESAGLGE